MEVLVAITVLLIALVGPLTIAQSGLKRAGNSREQVLGVFLAQEGIEAVVKWRDDNGLSATTYNNLNQVWGNMSNLPSCPSSGSDRCGVTVADNGIVTFYQCSGTNCVMKQNDTANVPFKQGSVSGTDTKYTRELTIDVTNDYAHVQSLVKWGEGSDKQVTMETYIYNIYYERP